VTISDMGVRPSLCVFRCVCFLRGILYEMLHDGGG